MRGGDIVAERSILGTKERTGAASKRKRGDHRKPKTQHRANRRENQGTGGKQAGKRKGRIELPESNTKTPRRSILTDGKTPDKRA